VIAADAMKVPATVGSRNDTGRNESSAGGGSACAAEMVNRVGNRLIPWSPTGPSCAVKR
jgi:hypothetical protein